MELPVIIEKAGIFAWPLLACSILSLAVILERSYFFFRNQGPGRELIATIVPMLRQNRIKDFEEYCKNTNGPLALICRVYLDTRDISKVQRDEVLFREGSMAIAQLERRLRALSLVAQVSPLLGLLGTVTGMIQAFQRIQEMGGQINIDALAGGIWEALLTTAIGLTIAIPTMAAHSFFESRIDRTQARMHYVIAYLNEWAGFGSDNMTTGLLDKNREKQR